LQMPRRNRTFSGSVSTFADPATRADEVIE
jgi:hypothetical protein